MFGLSVVLMVAIVVVMVAENHRDKHRQKLYISEDSDVPSHSPFDTTFESSSYHGSGSTTQATANINQTGFVNVHHYDDFHVPFCTKSDERDTALQQLWKRGGSDYTTTHDKGEGIPLRTQLERY